MKIIKICIKLFRLSLCPSPIKEQFVDYRCDKKELKVSWGSAYRLWYQIKEKHKGKSWESGVVDEWDIVQLSVHTDERKIYILGERIKTY